MIVVNCCKCGTELTEQGGLAFSPPNPITGLVQKYHFCVDCFWTIIDGGMHPPVPVEPDPDPRDALLVEADSYLSLLVHRFSTRLPDDIIADMDKLSRKIRTVTDGR